MPVMTLFPTLVFANVLPDHESMNREMLAVIKDEQARGVSGRVKSSHGGWHSPEGNALVNHQSFKRFNDLVAQAMSEVVDFSGYKGLSIVRLNTWSIVSPKGASNNKHNHPGSSFSGVYYVQVDEKSSPLVLHDPRIIRTFVEPNGNHSGNVEMFPITPKPGMLVIFPSWLDHSVPPNESDVERVVVSFNYAAAAVIKQSTNATTTAHGAAQE